MARQILTISGTDGSGKGTVANIVSNKLHKLGQSSYIISPPFYNTPIGGEVGNYLKTGYGCWKDRRLSSAMYALDRNWWMRENFHNIFIGFAYDVAIYNRNWIDSVLYQTTMIGPTEQDTATIRDIARRFYIDGNFTTHARANMNMLHMVFDNEELPPHSIYTDTAALIRDLPPVYREELKQFYFYNRIAMVQEHMNFLWNLEVEPYHMMPTDILPPDDFAGTVPFTTALPICNVVLIPERKYAGKIIRDNLLQRYGGDESKLDRNEVNVDYQESVIENIEWIHRHYNLITHEGNLHPILDASWRRVDMVNKGQMRKLSADIHRAFEYHIVYITDVGGNLRDPEDIASEVLKLARPTL